MIRNLKLVVILLATGSLLSSCGNNSASTDAPDGGAPPTTEATTSNATDNLKDPKGSISYQLEQIKAGDLDKLKSCFTERVRDRVTKEDVEKAKGDADKYTIDDLYASAEMGTDGGKKTAKVKMKNGRTLTTLIETDGQWLSDTIWYK